MTSPNGAIPSTAYAGTAGGQKVSGVQNETEAQIRAAGRAEGDAAYGNARTNITQNLLGGFINGIVGLISALFGGIFGGGGGGLVDLIGGFLGQKNKVAEQAGSIEGLESRVTALEGGGSRTAFSGNGVWTNPGNGSIKVAVINGGQGGTKGGGGFGGTGGEGGGYVLREFQCADLPATVDVTVGAGGALPGQLGGVSKFGTYLLGISSPTGSILTGDGAVLSTSAPGRGGNGSAIDAEPQSGTPSALAQGGYAGSTTNGYDGGAGQSVDIDSAVPSGGGGGGGGRGRGAAFSNSGKGGPGGAPGGGGGGGGGVSGAVNPAGASDPGPGANGRVIVIHTAGGVAT